MLFDMHLPILFKNLSRMTSNFSTRLMMNIITRENLALGEFLQSSLRLNVEHVEIYRRMIGEYAGHYEDEDTCLAIFEKVDEEIANDIREKEGNTFSIHAQSYGGNINDRQMIFNLTYMVESNMMRIVYRQNFPFFRHELIDINTELTNVDTRRNGIWKGIMLAYNNVVCRSCGVLVDTKDDICSECARTLCKKACEHCLSRRGKVTFCKKRRGQPSMWTHSICKKRRLE